MRPSNRPAPARHRRHRLELAGAEPDPGRRRLGLGTTPVAVSRALAAYGGATALSAFLLRRRSTGSGPRRALQRHGGLTVATLLTAVAMHWLMLALAQAWRASGRGRPALDLRPGHDHRTPGPEIGGLGRVLTGWSVSLVAGVPASALIAELGAGAPLPGPGRLGAPRCRYRPAAGPPSRDRGAGTVGPLAPLAYPSVPALLAVCLGFMTAFYGVYAFVGEPCPGHEHQRRPGGSDRPELRHRLRRRQPRRRAVDRLGPERAAIAAGGGGGDLLAWCRRPRPSPRRRWSGLWGFANHSG